MIHACCPYLCVACHVVMHACRICRHDASRSMIQFRFPKRLANASPFFPLDFFLDLRFSTFCGGETGLDDGAFPTAGAGLTTFWRRVDRSSRDTAVPLSISMSCESSDLATGAAATANGSCFDSDFAVCSSSGSRSVRTVLTWAKAASSMRPRAACWLSAANWVNALRGQDR